ncbi:MAG: VCBS repeat-containing protein [Deltaproteobacteria bacterium]|nr:VCBS repeat-containing protein [Deltaproteobacteria bacterium]
MRRTLVALLSTLGLSCVFGDVKSTEDAVPIEAIERPAEFSNAGAFGLVLDGYAGQSASGIPVSRIVATAGPGSGHVAIGVWDGDGDRPREAIFDGCEELTDCERTIGTDVIGFPLWNGMRDCVMTSAAEERAVRIQCESDSSMILRLAVPGTAGFGTALAAIPANNGAGVALIGAPEPGMVAESGELWKIVAGEVSPIQLTVGGDSGIGAGAQLGAALSAAELPSGDVMVAASAPGASRVVVFRLPADPTDLALETLGCVDATVVRPPGSDVMLGGAMAVGDVDGDGTPDLVLGDPAANRLSIVTGTSLTGAVGCVDPSTVDDPTSTRIDCASVDAPSVDTCGSFGAAVEIGDVNGDGIGDAVVGAPSSTVNGDADAGAVYTIPGSTGGLDASGGKGLGMSQTEPDMRLGEALATVPSQLTGAVRDEVVAAAPGDARLFLFWCSGVAGDDAAEGRDRCLER